MHGYGSSIIKYLLYKKGLSIQKSQPAITSSKLPIETLEQGEVWHMFKVNNS